MEQRTVNPFALVGKQHSDGLTAIEALITGTTNVDALQILVYNQVIAQFFSGTIDLSTQIELKSAISTAINGYNNSNVAAGASYYNEGQYYFINLLMKGLLTYPDASMADWIADVENNITKCDLSVVDQAPLLMATAVAAADLAYWKTKLKTPGNWSSYLPAEGLGLAKYIGFYVCSSVLGTLIFAKTSKEYSFIKSTTLPSASANIILAVTGSLIVAAGKAMYNWIPRIGDNDYMLNKIMNSSNRYMLSSFDPTTPSAGLSDKLTVDGYCCPTHKGGTCACPNGLDPCVNHPCGTTTMPVSK